ncbi:hypothetical protein FKM82_015273 [Ascaphus truei]
MAKGLMIFRFNYHCYKCQSVIICSMYKSACTLTALLAQGSSPRCIGAQTHMAVKALKEEIYRYGGVAGGQIHKVPYYIVKSLPSCRDETSNNKVGR